MEKRKIKKRDYEFLKRESEHLSEEEKSVILDKYEVQEGFNLVRVISLIGAVLLGIGVLSFIASNWTYMGKGLKFFVILLSIIGFHFGGLKLEKNSPKTARSLHYVAILIFGSGIFLVGQMFNFSSDFTNNGLLLWALGIIPVAYILKDSIIYVFITLLLSMYLFITAFMDETTPLIMLLILPVLYFLNYKHNYLVLFTFMLNALLLQTLFVFFIYANIINHSNYILVLLLFFGIGVGMVFLPVASKIKGVFEFQGHLIHGVFGFILTFSFVWSGSFFDSELDIFFAIPYFLLVLFFIKRGSLTNILIMGALILRFYIDFSYDFLPKSIIFIMSGVILILIGYLFEKKRKKGGDVTNEKN